MQNSLWIRKMIKNVQILISSTGADLTALLNLGYNLAERDISSKTPRDVAMESGVQDNINAIGKYGSPLLPISEQIKLSLIFGLKLSPYLMLVLQN